MRATVSDEFQSKGVKKVVGFVFEFFFYQKFIIAPGWNQTSNPYYQHQNALSNCATDGEIRYSSQQKDNLAYNHLIRTRVLWILSALWDRNQHSCKTLSNKCEIYTEIYICVYRSCFTANHLRLQVMLYSQSFVFTGHALQPISAIFFFNSSCCN